MKRRVFLGLAGAAGLVLALGRRGLAAVGRAAERAFPRPPWRRVTREDLRGPHDLAG